MTSHRLMYKGKPILKESVDVESLMSEFENFILYYISPGFSTIAQEGRELPPVV